MAHRVLRGRRPAGRRRDGLTAPGHRRVVGRDQVLGSEGIHPAEAGEHRRGAGRPLADASLDRRMAVRHGAPVAFAQIGMAGPDGQIEAAALRLYDLP